MTNPTPDIFTEARDLLYQQMYGGHDSALADAVVLAKKSESLQREIARLQAELRDTDAGYDEAQHRTGQTFRFLDGAITLNQGYLKAILAGDYSTEALARFAQAFMEVSGQYWACAAIGRPHMTWQQGKRLLGALDDLLESKTLAPEEGS